MKGTQGPQHQSASEARRALPFLLIVLCAVTGAACWNRPPTPSTESSSPEAPETVPQGGIAAPFAGWAKPDFAVLLSAQQHGYLLPCGCSRPQYGGLERRFNLLQQLRKERGWDVVALDLGDISQKENPVKRLPNPQGLMKYRYSMEALERMNYLAVSFGEFEAHMPLKSAMDEYPLNNPKPAVLAANLAHREKEFPPLEAGGKSYVGSWTQTQAGGVSLGVLGIVDTHQREKQDDPLSVAELIKARSPGLDFIRADQVIPGILGEMDKARISFRVLLYQGPLELAERIARALPAFQVILCLSAEDEPPSRPVLANEGKTLIVRVGHKGKNVGVVGVYKTGKVDRPYEMRYQLVRLGEEFQTPEDRVAQNPIIPLMERYTRELKDDDALGKYYENTHRVQADIQEIPRYKGQSSAFVGSEACRTCHKHAYKVWKESPHSHAYPTLVDARRPGNRQFDGECIVCHVVGFGYKTGYKNESSAVFLKAVGCESCHGPCGIHAKDANKNDEELYPIINPWRAKPNETPKDREKRMLAIESMCQQCHDQDNDVHWTFEKWDKKKIIHMTP